MKHPSLKCPCLQPRPPEEGGDLWAYLGAVIRLGLQVAEGNQPTQQVGLLVTRLDVAQLEDDLRLLDEELQINGEAGHVDGERPLRCEPRLPAVHLALGVDLG